MKLDRLTLIENVTNEMFRSQDAEVLWDRAVDAAEQDARVVWQMGTRNEWRVYRDEITALLRKAGPITAADVPKAPAPFRFERGKWETDWKGNPSWSRGTHDLGPKPRPDADQLSKLLSFLEAVTDEEISFESITRAGFKDGVRQAFGLPT